MMKRLFAGVTVLLLSVVANAGVILQPVDATTTAGEFSANFLAVNAINQSGLSAGYTSGVTDYDTYLATVPTHDATGPGYTWYSTDGVTTGYFDLDLGGLKTIQSMALWNEVQHLGLGVNVFALYGDVNSDFSTAVLLGYFTATEGLNTAEVFDFAPTEMAFLRIDILTNHGSSVVGIMEVAVEEFFEPPEISIVRGYIKLDTSNGTAPPDSHCVVEANYGRMFVDSVNNILYICTNSGWTTTTLTP